MKVLALGLQKDFPEDSWNSKLTVKDFGLSPKLTVWFHHDVCSTIPGPGWRIMPGERQWQQRFSKYLPNLMMEIIGFILDGARSNRIVTVLPRAASKPSIRYINFLPFWRRFPPPSLSLDRWCQRGSQSLHYLQHARKPSSKHPPSPSSPIRVDLNHTRLFVHMVHQWGPGRCRRRDLDNPRIWLVMFQDPIVFSGIVVFDDGTKIRPW